MAKKLLSEQVVNRWAKLSGVKLNENYGAMSGEREDDMGSEDMTPAEDTGIEMADEAPPMEEPMDGGDTSITKEDDELMAMLEKAVENVLVRMGLGDEGGSEGGGDELAEPDTDMEDLEGDDEEEGDEEEETLDEELEVVSDDEIINETLKRVIRRLVG